MTVQLSPHKVSKILRGYFCGLPQTKIAKEAGVDQSSISHYASRFKKTVAGVGLLAAGKEYKVLSEVESLRSLSVELYKSKLTMEEARQGHSIIKTFLKLGINPEQYHTLIKVCQEVGDPSFVEAAIRLSQVEAQTGVSYHQVMSSLEEAQNQLPRLEKKIAEAKAELKSINDGLLKNRQELARRQSQLVQLEEEMIAKKAKLGKELEAEMKHLSVEKQEVKEVAKLKSEMVERGLNISTLMQVAEEFKQ